MNSSASKYFYKEQHDLIDLLVRSNFTVHMQQTRCFITAQWIRCGTTIRGGIGRFARGDFQGADTVNIRSDVVRVCLADLRSFFEPVNLKTRLCSEEDRWLAFLLSVEVCQRRNRLICNQCLLE